MAKLTPEPTKSAERNQLYKNFVDCVRKRLKDSELTIFWLSKLCNVPYKDMAKVVYGSQRANALLVIQVQFTLDIDKDEILFGKFRDIKISPKGIPTKPNEAKKVKEWEGSFWDKLRQKEYFIKRSHGLLDPDEDQED